MGYDILKWCPGLLPKWKHHFRSGINPRSRVDSDTGGSLHAGDAIAYVRGAEAGLDIDDFAPQLSFFQCAQRSCGRNRQDRAARRCGEHPRERFSSGEIAVTAAARSRANGWIFAHAAAAGNKKTFRCAWPYKRGPVRGGCQSLHTNSLDESLACPTEDAALIALRTQSDHRVKPGCPIPAIRCGFVRRSKLSRTQ